MATKNAPAKKAGNKESPAKIPEGEILRDYLIRNRISISRFIELTNKSRGWAYDLFKQSELKLNQKVLISYVFGRPFDELLKTEIINNIEEMTASEVRSNENKAKLETLLKENMNLLERIAFLEELLRANVKVINLQSTLIENKDFAFHSNS